MSETGQNTGDALEQDVVAADPGSDTQEFQHAAVPPEVAAWMQAGSRTPIKPEAGERDSLQKKPEVSRADVERVIRMRLRMPFTG